MATLRLSPDGAYNRRISPHRPGSLLGATIVLVTPAALRAQVAGPAGDPTVIVAATGTRRNNDLNQARKALTKVDAAIRRLLDAIKEGVMSVRDAIFAQRITERRSEKSALITTIDGLERQLARGAAQSTPDAVEKFKGDNATLRKAYVRLPVEKAEVSGAEIRSSGSRGALEAALISRALPRGRVPSFDREWCAGQNEEDHIYIIDL